MILNEADCDLYIDRYVEGKATLAEIFLHAARMMTEETVRSLTKRAQDQINELTRELEECRAQDPRDFEPLARKEHERTLAVYHNDIEENKQFQAGLERLLEQMNAWSPDYTWIEEIRQLVLKEATDKKQQAERSLQDRLGRKYLYVPFLKTGETYKQHALARLRGGRRYARRHLLWHLRIAREQIKLNRELSESLAQLEYATKQSC